MNGIMLTLATALAAGPSGYVNGTGSYDVSASPRLDGATACWTRETAAWSNAQPALWDGLVCYTSEPTTLTCVSAEDGSLVWEATNDVIDTFAGDAYTAKRARLTEAEEAVGELARVRSSYSALRREIRRAPERAPELTALQAELTRLTRVVDGAAPLQTPADKEIIGYSTPTPLVRGDALFVAYGNGVVSRYTSDGERVWSVWLGPAPAKMNGYHMGVTASPVWADGLLLVAHGALTALDPETGAVRWKADEPYLDFGTPTVVDVVGTAYAALPSGVIMRASDGTIMARDLGELWYVGPAAHGDVLFYVGGRGPMQIKQAGYLPARALRLVSSDGGLSTQELWSSKIPAEAPLYSAPVVRDGRLYAMDRDAHLWVIDIQTGSVGPKNKLYADEPGLGTVYGPLVSAHDSLYVSGEGGVTVRIAPGVAPSIVGQMPIGASRSAPVFAADGRMFLRTLESISCWNP